MIQRLFLAICALALGASALAADPLRFDRLNLEVPEGRILDWAIDDLNGDGLDDLIAVCVVGFRPAERVYTAFFLQSQEGFPTQPNRLLEMKPGWILQDLGMINGRMHHCVLDRKGILCQPWEAEKFGEMFRLAEIESMAAVGEDGDTPMFNFLHDWLGTGAPTVGLPTLDGFEIWSLAPPAPSKAKAEIPQPKIQPEKIATLKLAPYSYLSSGMKTGGYRYDFMLSATYRYPRLFSGDVNGDGRTDLIAQWLERLQAFHQDEKGTFSAEPEEKVFIDLLTAREKRRGGVKFQHTVRDINGDGIVDVVANKVSGGVREMKSVTQLHLADPTRPVGSCWVEEPDQTLNYEGFAGQLSFVDWDRDGDTDLIVPNVEIGVWEIVRVLMAGSINVTYYLHRFANGRFAEKGEELMEASLSIDLGRGAILDGLRPSFGHDFNGDNLPDAVTANHEELTIHLSDKDGELDDEMTIEIPVSPYFRFVDLNRDGKKDVLGIYPQDQDKERRIAILLSRAN